jgi:SSS family solute:Na+ symporter
MFIPFSVAMFPHLFQHWLTAKSAKSFRLSVVAHPLLMMLTWLPCVLVGLWATSAINSDGSLLIPIGTNQNSVLPIMVAKLAKSPLLSGLLTAGVLAAIMSSLDSQFLCLGSIFTNDIVGHYMTHDRLSDKNKVLVGRVFIIIVVGITYYLSWKLRDASVFKLGVWCFTGFAALAPLVFGALYWRRLTKAGAYATILTAVGVGGYLFWKVSELDAGDDATVWGVMPVAVVIGASTLAMFVVSLMTRPPGDATLAKFFKS